MRLSDYKGEKAVEKFADILEPVCAILSDPEVSKMIKANMPTLKVVQAAMKIRAKDMVKIMAILDDADPETYEPTLMEIPARVLEMLNDGMLVNLFTSQSQKEDSGNSGSAMASTEVAKN